MKEIEIKGRVTGLFLEHFGEMPVNLAENARLSEAATRVIIDEVLPKMNELCLRGGEDAVNEFVEVIDKMEILRDGAVIAQEVDGNVTLGLWRRGIGVVTNQEG